MIGSRTTSVLGAVLALATASTAQTTFPEVEPNENKGIATFAGPMSPGDMLAGSSTGAVTTAGAANSLDTWLVQTAAAAQDLYRYRLVITSDIAGHTGTIRGLNQTTGGIGATDSVVQTSSTATFPPRFVQWYGFGRSEQIYVRVTGAAATTLPYLATLEREVVAPQVIFDPIVTGPVTISSIGQTTANTDMWLYDSNFNAIFDAGNDDESLAGGGTGGTAQSLLTRNLAPGVYYLAITVANLANNQASPLDDDVRTGVVLDFADCVANSSTAVNQNVSFTIGHLGGTVPIFATRAEQYEIVWLQFTVVPDTANRPPFGVARADPAAGFNDGATTATFTVEVTSGNNPPSTGIAVTMDASAVGLSNLTLLDDGVAPDAVAGDLIFTASGLISSSTPAGPNSLTFLVSDMQGRSTPGMFNYNINGLQHDFGNVTPGASTSQTVDVAAAEIKWFRFSLSQDVDGNGPFVDIDTEFSAGCQDTEIGVYRSDGTLVASDDDDGSGGVGVSSLSFGTGTRAASTSCGTGGVAYNGRDGTLVAGTYYIAVGRFNVTFGGTSFGATSTGPAGAGIQLNLRANVIIGQATATPANVLNDGMSSSVLTVTSGLPLVSASFDASAIGGSSNIPALDNGVDPDAIAGDNIFSARVNVADGAAAGNFQLGYMISNGMQNSPGTLNLTVVETVGACCQPAGCSVMPRTACLGAGGSFTGHGVPCISAEGYQITSTGAGAFEDISATGTLVSTTGDDTVFSNIAIGFTFNHFGTPFTACNISTNGNIQFAPSASTAYLNQPIPTAAVPNNFIAPAWDDFNFGVNTTDDGLFTETRGTPGVDLRFIVQWTNVSQFGITAPGDRNTFQAVLFEDGRVEFRYLQLGDLSFDSIAGGAGATIGMENADGSGGTQYDFLLVAGGTGLRVDLSSPTDNCANDCPIDFNGDGDINADDLGDFINCYFSVPPCDGADFNNDSDVNADDLGDYINAYFSGDC
ncbi:MAG: nidogen-like domain-containing protein [Phycisphaerales bacterium]